MAPFSRTNLAWHLFTTLTLLTFVQAQCPTTTEGVDPRLLSACSVLSAEIASELLTANSANAILTLTFIPTSVPISPSSASASTSIIVSSSSRSSILPAATSTNPSNSRASTTSSRSTITAGSSSGIVIVAGPSSSAAVSNATSSSLNLSSSSVATSTSPASSSPSSSTTSNSAGGGNLQGASAPSSQSHLSGGAIAGIVVGSVIGASLLLALLLCCCFFLRRRRRRDPDQTGTVDGEKQNHSGYRGSGAAPLTTAAAAPALAAVPIYRDKEKESLEPVSPARTSSDSTNSPWAVQPLRHFRRSYETSPPPAPTAESSVPFYDQPALAGSGAGLSALTEASEEDDPFYDAPKSQNDAYGSAKIVGGAAAATKGEDLRTFFADGHEEPSPVRRNNAAGTKDSDVMVLESTQGNLQPAPRSDRPLSTSFWSGMFGESDSWWNSGVPSVAGSGSAIGIGEVDSGTGIIQGPWRGNLARSEIGLADGESKSMGDGASEGDTHTGMRRWSIPRKPISASVVGIAL